MKLGSILIVGGGIGGLTAAIALRRKGYPVEIIEKDADWTVYGVGIIQQFNVLRAMASLDLIDAYLDKAFGFDRTALFAPDGSQIAAFDTPRLAGPDYPSNAGIKRTDLQRVLADRAQELGAMVRLGLTVDQMADDGTCVDVAFSDGSTGRYDIVIGADGVYSQTRAQILPDAPAPRYTGQWVWRYNMTKPSDLDGIHVYYGRCNAGLVPLSEDLMYIFLLSQEEPGMKLAVEGSAAAMRARAAGAAPRIAELTGQITDDAGVVGRPLEVIFLEGDWHKGRVVLLGDAVHGATPHLAQGAGMAIEDAIVLAEELETADTADAAFTAYRARRFKRAEFIATNSVRLGDAQMGKIEPIDAGEVNRQTIALVAEPI
ncbi:FAD-dependent monooxygenase [Seohaeicola saemankumensis]|nr:FAD-dependent monooxygenase [Seohaeicola saemankumensis]MCA0871515.1 FAD-dependent monooxygenase [Seohaeicola saemankumensis]